MVYLVAIMWIYTQSLLVSPVYFPVCTSCVLSVQIRLLSLKTESGDELHCRHSGFLTGTKRGGSSATRKPGESALLRERDGGRAAGRDLSSRRFRRLPRRCWPRARSGWGAGGGGAHCVHHLLAGESMLSEGKRDQADGAAPARRPWVLSVSRAWRSVHLPGGRQERVGPGCWHLGHFARAKPFPGFLTDTPTLWGPSEGPPSGLQL